MKKTEGCLRGFCFSEVRMGAVKKEMKCLTEICFVLSEEYRTPRREQEVSETKRGLETEGKRVRILEPPCQEETEDGFCLPDGKETYGGTLFLADSALLFQKLSRQGLCCVGYLHDGNRDVQLEKAPYLIEQPQEVDFDSYEKIWQRLSHLPWTIAVTERLVIREMVAEDLEDLYLLYEDPEARKFLEPPSADREKEAAILASYIEKVYPFYGCGMWAVCDREDGRMIGRVGFEPYRGAGEAVDFGYLIRRDLRGRGLALEACRAALAFAGESLGMTRIGLHTDSRNLASLALAERLGFSEEKEEGEQNMPVVDGSQKAGIRYFVKDLSGAEENSYDQ